MDDLDRSASSMSTMIRSGQVSSEELVRACLDRIEAVNPALNAVVQFDERAIERAGEADRAVAAGNSLGPLHGVPITIKDSLDTQGVVSTAGTAGRRSYVPERSATAVARLRDAGAILVGKTNTPELTLQFDTENLVYGHTRNPSDPARSPGGSSGGAAAIIAASGSPLDLGTDTGGSIRLPAHFCGVAGIKPTSGRVPRTGHVISYDGLHQSLTQVGPIARKVEDLTLALRIIAGPDGTDPHVPPVPLRDPDGVDVSGLRVAWHADNGIATPVDEIARTVDAAVRVLHAEVATMSEAVPLGLAAYEESANDLWMGDGGAWAKRILESTGTDADEVGPYLRKLISDAPVLDAAEITRLLEVRDRFRAEALAFWDEHDVLICPVNAHVAVLAGQVSEIVQGASYTYLYNELGWPGAVVRCGATAAGLPIGIQVLAAPWREDRCLAVARRLEALLGGWQPVGDASLLG